jgi:hypothetical protein
MRSRDEIERELRRWEHLNLAAGIPGRARIQLLRWVLGIEECPPSERVRALLDHRAIEAQEYARQSHQRSGRMAAGKVVGHIDGDAIQGDGTI